MSAPRIRVVRQGRAAYVFGAGNVNEAELAAAKALGRMPERSEFGYWTETLDTKIALAPPGTSGSIAGWRFA